MKIIWNDPNCIKGNNYEVNSITYIANGHATITYNNNCSEAEVFINELEIINKEIK